MINIFIDDLRQAPDKDCLVCRTTSEGLAAVASAWTYQQLSSDPDRIVDKLYLDFDMGPINTIEPVVDFLSAVAQWQPLDINTIFVVSQNPVGANRMMKQLEKNYNVRRLHL